MTMKARGVISSWSGVLVCSVGCFLTLRVGVVHAFASYMTTKSGCMIELDTSEVIMNNVVQAAKPWSETTTTEDDIQLVVTTLDGQSLATAPDSATSSSVPPDRQVLLLPQIPATVQVKVQGNVPDAQYVLQAGFVNQQPDEEEDFTGATFENGQCDNHARYAGRINDAGTTLTITNATSTQVWAGWAAGHETVKLIPGFMFQLAANNNDQQDLDSHETTTTWMEFLSTEIGCTSVRFDESPEQVGERRVQASPQVSLSLGEVPKDNEEDNSSYYAVELRGDATVEAVVVEVTAGGHWMDTFHTAKTACASTRVVWSHVPSETFDVGRLATTTTSGEPPTTLEVRALYAVSNQPNVLYRTPALTIRTVHDDNEVPVAGRRQQQRQVDPQKKVDLNHRRDAGDLQGQIQAHRAKQNDVPFDDDVGARRHQPRENNDELHLDKLGEKQQHGFRQMEEPPLDGKKQRPAYDDDEGHIPGLGEVQHRDRAAGLTDVSDLEKPKHKLHADHDPYQDLGQRQGGGRAHQEKLRLSPEEQLAHMKEGVHRDTLNHADRLKNKLAEQTSNRREKLKRMDGVRQINQADGVHRPVGIRLTQGDIPTVSFDGAYFSALVFFLGSTVATIQLCRCASTRGSKGRRDL